MDGSAPTDRFYWVVDHALAAGAYPGAPDPADDSIVHLLLEAGVDAFVNLTYDTEATSADATLNRYDGFLDDHAFVVRRPIVDLGVPSVDEMVEILDTVDGLLGDGRTVYVHCWGGIGRTGMVVACWLVRHELAHPADVLGVLARLRRQDRRAGHLRSPQTDEQRAFVEDWRPGR
jgi:hypothetical protein